MHAILKIFRSQDDPATNKDPVMPSTPSATSLTEGKTKLGNNNTNSMDTFATLLKSSPLITFDGNQTNFSAFWKRFSVVHNSGISNIRKLTYLKTYLGSSACVIQHLGSSDECYDLAVETLFKKYNYHSDVAYGKLFDQLLEVPIASDDVNSIQSVVDKMENILIEMRSIGEDMEDVALCDAYMKRIPNRFRSTFKSSKSFTDFRQRLIENLKLEQLQLDIEKSLNIIDKTINPGNAIVKPKEIVPPTPNVTEVLKRESDEMRILRKELKNVSLSNAQLPTTYSAVTQMEQILNKMISAGGNMNDPTIRVIYEARLPKWVLKQSDVVVDTDSFPVLRQKVLKFLNGLMQHREEQAKRIQLEKAKKTASTEVAPIIISTPRSAPLNPLRAESNGFTFPEPGGICFFCQKHPFSYHCTVVTTFTDRMKMINENSKCHRCLGDHKQEHCKDVLPCGYCGKRSHHISVCLKNPILKPTRMVAPNKTMIPTNTKPKCAFCEKTHDSNICRNYKNFESRWNVVRSKKLCAVCLQDHGNRQCSIKQKCSYCDFFDHHKSLCRQKSNVEGPQQRKAGTPPTMPKSDVSNNFVKKTNFVASTKPEPVNVSPKKPITNKPNYSCIFCGSHNYSLNCSTVTNIQQRRTILERMGRCERCLLPHSKNHSPCFVKTCQYCDGLHGSVLCPKNPSIVPAKVVVTAPTVPSQNPSIKPLMSLDMKDYKVPCLFCESHSFDMECRKEIYLNNRLDIVDRKKRCHNCLESHDTGNCTVYRSCKYCDIPGHHHYLCSDNPHIERVSIRGPPRTAMSLDGY